jgi:hypothetical protein
MTIKKEYAIGDSVWISGVSTNKLVKGTVIYLLDLSAAGYGSKDRHYVIAVPSAIEPLLEIRTWETISQDQHGPVGGIRLACETVESSSVHKKLKQFGYEYHDDSDIDDEPTPEEIHAAMERASKSAQHEPLPLKEPKPNRRFYGRKKK